jgi:hypothetical protein
MIAVFAVALLMSQTQGDPPRSGDRVSADRLLCRNEQQPATRIPRRVCMTEYERSGVEETADQHRARVRPVIDNRRPGRGIGRW